MVKISSYTKITDPKPVDISIIDFIEGVRDGKWQDTVLSTRVLLEKTQDRSERSKIKGKNPLVRLSGIFKGQKDSDLIKHSGYIGIDIDSVESVDSIKKLVKKDPYIFSAFTSISGGGLCLVFKIDGARHQDAFEALGSYLRETYSLIIDRSCKNVSRARYVSYDPYLFLNEDASVFKKYLPKRKAVKTNKVVFVKTDFDRIVKEMHNRNINICEDYRDWIAVGYAIASEYGDSQQGLDYFTTLSSLSSKHNDDDAAKQYKSCLNTLSGSKSRQATIGLIYYHAKQNGIDLYSKETKEIVRSASSMHKSGVDVEGIQKVLVEQKSIDPKVSKPIVEQVIKENIKFESDNIIEDIVDFLSHYDLKKNLITRNVEKMGKPIDDTDLNSLYLDTRVVYEKSTKDLVTSIVFSNRIPAYNPIHEFFKGVEIVSDYPNLQSLIDSVITDTPNHGKWITKWLVSGIASAYGKHSPLMLVLSGEKQGTGKTHWFRYLLPQRLQSLFAESKMDNGKDDEILMTKKWMILDDEFGGKSKKEEKRLKEITSKQWINIREPYGRVSVDLRRLAIFCGTSNDTQLLNDPTGNRRILPVHVLDIDHSKYNQCDKEQLLVELYSLFKTGYDYTILKSEIAELNDNTGEFKASSQEEELISTKISPGTGRPGDEWLTITDVVQYIIADTKITYLSNTKVGMVLTSLGYEKKRKWSSITNNAVTVYCVRKENEQESKENEDLPF